MSISLGGQKPAPDTKGIREAGPRPPLVSDRSGDTIAKVCLMRQ